MTKTNPSDLDSLLETYHFPTIEGQIIHPYDVLKRMRIGIDGPGYAVLVVPDQHNFTWLVDGTALVGSLAIVPVDRLHEFIHGIPTGS